MRLKDAYRHIAFQNRLFCKMKESNEPLKDDYFLSVVHFRRGDELLQHSPRQSIVEEFLKDKTITTRYLTSELVDDELKLLALANLGIEFLLMTCCFEDVEEARQIFNEAMEKKRKELYI